MTKTTYRAIAIVIIVYAAALLLILKPFLAHASELTPQDILLLVNNDRKSAGLKPLAVDKSLSEVAQGKADDEAKNGYFAHISPAGVRGLSLIKTKYWIAGENLGLNFDNALSLEASWMASPSHKANLLNGHYTKTGIGISEGFYQGHKVNFIVEFFIMPR
jgi:uncharacterized protein YkwD